MQSLFVLMLCVTCRPLHKEVMQDRVMFICGKEGVQLDTDAFELLAQVPTCLQTRRFLGACSLKSVLWVMAATLLAPALQCQNEQQTVKSACLRVQPSTQQQHKRGAPVLAVAVLQVSGGDLRKAVTTLQSSVRLGGNKVSR